MSLNEALLTQERDGTAQLKALAKAFPINWHARVGALVVAECLWKCRGERGLVRMAKTPLLLN